MTTAFTRASLLALSLILLQVSLPSQGQDPVASPRDPGTSEEQAYHSAIMEMEASEGAYADGLSESLLGLARTLQSQGRHDEAIQMYRRGVHLTRINEGLYSAQQIPLLQGEILSYMARGNYPLADERQNYLYRVQLASLQDTDQFDDALMAQANWQRQGYQLGLGGASGYNRLMSMLELYRMAMEDVLRREGDLSPNLLPPLRGMLQAQYLISGHEVADSQQIFGEDGRPNESLLRFKTYRSKSYKQGSAIITAMADIEAEHSANPGDTVARSMVMLGDWHLWHGRTEEAWEAYGSAEAELASRDDAKVRVAEVFGQPVALPDMASLNPLPPEVDPEQGDILLGFAVSDSGRVHDLERMDDEDETEGRRASRLMRQLRKTPFRPRFEAGQPVETEHIVKAFDMQ